MGTPVAEQITISPIGYFKSQQVHPYEAGRQPDENHSEGVIELLPGQQFEQALLGLEGVPRIWVLFSFHHNEHWNPMVLPPRGRNTKIGVFATRSPYRPNQIGMSCVEIKSIDKLSITVKGADLLDGSPILDIKPYVAYADSFPGVEPEWLQESQALDVIFSQTAENQLLALEKFGLNQLRGFLKHQLEYEPTNGKKKRVKAAGEKFVIAYRTWRAEFVVSAAEVSVERLFSGYSEEDLKNIEADPYQDKALHLEFKKLFPY